MPRPIDADALIVEQCGQCDGACEMFDGEKCLACKADCRCDLREAIDNAPALDYAPVRHGEWVKDKDDLYWGNHFIHQHCSLCGGEAHLNRFGTAYILSAFCPNCGARMDAKEDADENA